LAQGASAKAPPPSGRRETKQDPFDIEPDEFHVSAWPMHYIYSIASLHVKNMDMILSDFGCPALHWRVLSILNEEDAKTIGYLAQISVIQRSNLSYILESMEGAGLIVREDMSGDRRKTLVHITQKGRRLFAETLPAILDYYRKFLDGLSDDKIEEFIKVLRRIKKNIGSAQSEIVGW
jgi:DNA-binding MarR family transcriptional regulator